MSVDAIKNTLIIREFRGSERKSGGKSGGVHVTGNHEAVFTVRECGFERVFHGKRSGFGNNEERSESGLNLLSNCVEFLDGVGRDGDIERKLEEAFSSFNESFLERFSIIKGSLSACLRDTTSFDVRIDFSFHFSNTTTKIVEGVFGVRREDIHGNIERVVKVDERGEPVGRNVTRVANNEKSAEVFIFDFNVAEVYFDVRRSDDVLDGSGLLVGGRGGGRFG